MNTKSLIIGMVCGLVIAGAGIGFFKLQDNKQDVAESTNQSETVENQSTADTHLFTNVYRGDGTKNTYPKDANKAIAILVNSKDELSAVWGEVFKGNLAPTKPVVDFNTQTVIITMLEQKTEGEYLLTTQDIVQESNKLVISAQEKGPGNGCPSRKVASRPIHVVIAKKLSAQSTEVVLEKTSAAPCQIPLN